METTPDSVDEQERRIREEQAGTGDVEHQDDDSDTSEGDDVGHGDDTPDDTPDDAPTQ